MAKYGALIICNVWLAAGNIAWAAVWLLAAGVLIYVDSR